VIYLIRHGEGEHNAWRRAEQAAGRKPTAKRHNAGQYPASLHDPLLTTKGLEDATAAAAAARRLPRPELLVTSPMRRAVQTLLTSFDDAVTARVPAIAHELCREAFHGTDPSIYDSRLSREALAATFPNVDFDAHVLPPTPADDGHGAAPIDDPLWWYCKSPFGLGGAQGIDEAAIAEHAYRFLQWLMARPEGVIAVASHCNFLLALYHACLDGCPEAPQVFHTGELRAVTVSASPATPVSVRALLGTGVTL
jgi:broad specificity phosphatase PhoE